MIYYDEQRNLYKFHECFEFIAQYNYYSVSKFLIAILFLYQTHLVKQKELFELYIHKASDFYVLIIKKEAIKLFTVCYES